MNLTPIIIIVASLVLLAISGALIPLIHRKLTAEQNKDLDRIIDLLVQAAEQTFGSGMGAEKLEQVCDWLKERGYDVDLEAIEAAVHRLHTHDSIAESLTDNQ
jgi:hypothetical protein